MHRVMIHPADYENCRRAVDRAFELFPIDVRGRKVLVKPNALRASKAEEAITTHPAVVRAVVERLEEMAPASLIVADNPGMVSYGTNEATFKQTGLMDGSNGHYRNIGDDSVLVDFNPEFADRVSVSQAILEADVLISVPKFKTHGLTVITGAIKNNYGILPGAQKAKLHQKAGSPERFHEMLVDVFKLRVPDFFIMDAVVGMEGNGPASTELRDVGLILASDNAVAMDATMARLMGLAPEKLRFLAKAKDQGLGDYEETAIEIIGDLVPIPDYNLPPLSGEAIAGSSVIAEFLESRVKLRPSADPELCTGCGSCVEQCPVSALALVDDMPQVDPELCITCFCCQELCPEKAMELK